MPRRKGRQPRKKKISVSSTDPSRHGDSSDPDWPEQSKRSTSFGVQALAPSDHELGRILTSAIPVSVTPISAALQAARLDTPMEDHRQSEDNEELIQQGRQQVVQEVTASDNQSTANVVAPLVLNTVESLNTLTPTMNHTQSMDHEETITSTDEPVVQSPTWYDMRPPGSPRSEPSEEWGQNDTSFYNNGFNDNGFSNGGFENNSWNEASSDDQQPSKFQRTQFGGRPRGHFQKQWNNSYGSRGRNTYGKRQWFPTDSQMNEANQMTDVKEAPDFPTENYIQQRPDGTSEWFIPPGLPVKTWSRQVPFHYRVIQRQKDLCIAVHDPPSRKEILNSSWSAEARRKKELIKDPEDLPPLIVVRYESLMSSGVSQSQYPKPLVGDTLFVRKVTIRSGKTVQLKDVPISAYKTSTIQASATGCNASIAARRFKIRTVAMSVVAVSTERGEPRIRVCGRYRLQTAVVPPLAVPPECHDLKRGDQIEVHFYSPLLNSWLPAQEQYCLPPNCKMTSDEKRTTSNTQFIAGIAKWQPEVNGINNFVHPLKTLSSMDFEKIKYYQDFMLSAAARAHEQKVSEMKRAAHTGKPSPLENGEVQFVTERCYNEEEWAIRTKLWKEEAIVVISPTEYEGAFQPVGIAQLTAVEVDEDERTFSVTLRAEPLKAGERDIKPESVLGCIIRGQLEAKVSFSESNTQFKSLMDVHNDNKIASAFRHGYPVQYPLSVMLGISHLLPPPQLKNAVLQTNNDDLNPEQLESLLCTLRRQPLTFTGASAGTGKTLVLGRLGREWYLLHEGVLLIVAPSNNASTNCTEAFVKCTNPAADEFLVIQSNAFNRSAAGQLPVSFTESRLLATTKRVYDEQKESMEEAEKLAIEDYISRSEDGMSFHVPDDKALTFVLKHRKPRIIFCTLGMLHKCKGKLEPFITGVAIDEAAVLTEQELTTAMAMLRNVETVSFVGDPKQSKSHDFDVPDGVRSYGLFPVTDVVEARGIPKIDLRYTYRFGKLFLERLVSPACYDDLLKCGADDTLHRRFFDLKFHGVSPQVPAIIFNTDARDVRNLAKSRHNEQQRSGALRMAKSILKQQPDACIAILTYYAAEAGACQHELVRRGLKEIVTFTVDKYQGRECDYALVLLSRAHNEAEEFEASKFKFILDPNRATVSVTRCRQGLFVFGQVSLLRRNDVWNKFLTALEPHSPILQLENLDDLIDNAE